MLDRFVTSAGAVADAIDRAIRGVARGPATASRPVSLFVAALLVALAGLFLLGAREVVGERVPAPVAAGVVDASGLGPRTHATIDGSLASTYVEYFDDYDFDGEWDDGEPLTEWNYFLVDPASRAGLTVVSARPPSELFTMAATGLVVQDAEYVSADLDAFAALIDQHDLDLDRRHYVDTTLGSEGVAHELAVDLPAAGTTIAINGSRSAEFIPVCGFDRDSDDVCDDDEVDRYDVLVYDPVSRRAVVVGLAASPEFVPMAMTGIVRDDPDAVSVALAGPDDPTVEWDLELSSSLVLDDGAEPGSGWLLVAIAGGLVVLAAVIAIGALGGGVRFRVAPVGAGDALASAQPPGEDDAVALRVTGRLHGRGADLLVREAEADLVPFALTAAGAQGPMTRLIQRRGRAEGVAVGPDDLRGPVERGSVASLRGERPALRVPTVNGPLILTFDDTAARDRADAALRPVLSPPNEEASTWMPGN